MIFVWLEAESAQSDAAVTSEDDDLLVGVAGGVFFLYFLGIWLKW